jgi:uncharacterized metal-binding protein YceD (DUF177 family)
MTAMSRRGRSAENPWSVPVAQTEIPESGRHFDLTADQQTRNAIAGFAGVDSLPRLAAHFDVTLHGRAGLRVVGHVSATVGQTCSVTLEPMESDIDEAVDLVFLPAAPPSDAKSSWTEVEIPVDDAPEALVDGSIDLGAIATEFLVLGIDPYPRKAGTQFQFPASHDDAARPFAALAALRKPKPGKPG